MLNIYFGNMLESIYNMAVFKNVYEKWILEPLVKEIIADIDKSIYSVTDRTDKKYISYI